MGIDYLLRYANIRAKIPVRIDNQTEEIIRTRIKEELWPIAVSHLNGDISKEQAEEAIKNIKVTDIIASLRSDRAMASKEKPMEDKDIKEGVVVERKWDGLIGTISAVAQVRAPGSTNQAVPGVMLIGAGFHKGSEIIPVDQLKEDFRLAQEDKLVWLREGPEEEVMPSRFWFPEFWKQLKKIQKLKAPKALARTFPTKRQNFHIIKLVQDLKLDAPQQKKQREKLFVYMCKFILEKEKKFESKDYLALMRIINGLSEQALGRKVGESASFIFNIERGVGFRLEKLRRILQHPIFKNDPFAEKFLNGEILTRKGWKKAGSAMATVSSRRTLLGLLAATIASAALGPHRVWAGQASVQATNLSAFFLGIWSDYMAALAKGDKDIGILSEDLVRQAGEYSPRLRQMMRQLTVSAKQLSTSGARQFTDRWTVFNIEYLIPNGYYGELDLMKNWKYNRYYYDSVIYKLEGSEPEKRQVEKKEILTLYGRKIDRLNRKRFSEAQSFERHRIVFINLDDVDTDAYKILGTVAGGPYLLATFDDEINIPLITLIERKVFSGMNPDQIKEYLKHILRGHEFTHQAQDMLKVKYKGRDKFGIYDFSWGIMNSKMKKLIDEETVAMLGQFIAAPKLETELIKMFSYVLAGKNNEPYYFGARWILNKLDGKPVENWTNWMDDNGLIEQLDRLLKINPVLLRTQIEKLIRDNWSDQLLETIKKADSAMAAASDAAIPAPMEFNHADAVKYFEDIMINPQIADKGAAGLIRMNVNNGNVVMSITDNSKLSHGDLIKVAHQKNGYSAGKHEDGEYESEWIDMILGWDNNGKLFSIDIVPPIMKNPNDEYSLRMLQFLGLTKESVPFDFKNTQYQNDIRKELILIYGLIREAALKKGIDPKEIEVVVPIKTMGVFKSSKTSLDKIADLKIDGNKGVNLEYLNVLSESFWHIRQDGAYRIRDMFTQQNFLQITKELIENFIEPVGIKETKENFESQTKNSKKIFNDRRSRRIARTYVWYALYYAFYQKFIIHAEFPAWAGGMRQYIVDRLEQEARLWLENNQGAYAKNPSVIKKGTPEENNFIERYQWGHRAAELPQKFQAFSLLENLRLFLLVRYRYTDKELEKMDIYYWLYYYIECIIPQSIFSNTARKVLFALPDAAMRSVKTDQRTPGGIDLNSDKALTVQNNGQGIKFHIDPAMLEQLQNAPGFTPVIINIRPMTDLRMFLGLSETTQNNSIALKS